MRKLLLPITALLLLAAGCSKTEGSRESPSDGVIHLCSGVRGTNSAKAGGGLSETFTAQVCGWEGSAEGVDLGLLPGWTGTAVIRTNAVNEGFDINPLSYYNREGKTTTIRAWYPQGKPEDGKVLYDNPNGNVDILLTQSVSGTLVEPINTPLIFEHMTSLLRFEIIGFSWDPSEKITGITVKGVSLPNGLDITAGKLIAVNAADFALRGIPTEGVIPQEQSAQRIGEVLMMVPTDATTLYIDVTTTTKSYTNIPVTAHNEGSYCAGVAYTVTLTFSSFQGITVGSTSDFEEWGVGTTGSGSIQ